MISGIQKLSVQKVMIRTEHEGTGPGSGGYLRKSIEWRYREILIIK